MFDHQRYTKVSSVRGSVVQGPSVMINNKPKWNKNIVSDTQWHYAELVQGFGSGFFGLSMLNDLFICIIKESIILGHTYNIINNLTQQSLHLSAIPRSFLYAIHMSTYMLGTYF